MSPQSIVDRIQLIFRDILDPNLVVTEDLDASKVPEWDSLNHISLVVAIEAEFGIELTAQELVSMRDVGDMVRLIQQKAGSNG